MHINLLTDQSARHRVRVGGDTDRAPLGHSYPPPVPGIDTPRGEIVQQRAFLGEPPGPAAIALVEDLAEEPLVGRSVLEVAAVPQHEGLVHRGFESVMALLGISILMRLTGIDGL